MSQVNIKKTTIIEADGSAATSTSKVYARAQSSSSLNTSYTLGFVEIGTQAQFSQSTVEANQFYEI